MSRWGKTTVATEIEPKLWDLFPLPAECFNIPSLKEKLQITQALNQLQYSNKYNSYRNCLRYLLQLESSIFGLICPLTTAFRGPSVFSIYRKNCLQVLQGHPAGCVCSALWIRLQSLSSQWKVSSPMWDHSIWIRSVPHNGYAGGALALILRGYGVFSECEKYNAGPESGAV